MLLGDNFNGEGLYKHTAGVCDGGARKFFICVCVCVGVFVGLRGLSSSQANK